MIIMMTFKQKIEARFSVAKFTNNPLSQYTRIYLPIHQETTSHNYFFDKGKNTW